MAHRIREGCKVGKVKLAGPVEADETYIGGKEHWKHADKKLKIGGGTAGKAIVAGLKDQATNQISAAVIPSVQKVHLIPFVADQTKQLATVYTDDLQSYVGMPRLHKSVNHSAGQYVDGQAHVNGVESFWAMLKRGYHGTYHQLSHKHLDRYVSELAGRHNIRPLDTEEQMSVTAQQIVGKRLPYSELIG